MLLMPMTPVCCAFKPGRPSPNVALPGALVAGPAIWV
jgi:hypothetical protein